MSHMESSTAPLVAQPAAAATEHAGGLALRRYWPLLLVGILLLGAGLRYRGLAWDAGQNLHPDERFLTMVTAAIELPGSVGAYFDTATSPLNPYNRGFDTFVYGTAPLFVVRLVAELLNSTEYGQVYLVGRALSALADLFVLLLVFATGRRLYGLRGGLAGSLFYALSVFPIQTSHFFTVDSFTNVPLMLAFWFTLDIAGGRRKWTPFFATGVFFGLLVASRVNLAVFAAIIVAAGLLRLKRALEVDKGALDLPVGRLAGRLRLSPVQATVLAVLTGLLLTAVTAVTVFRVSQPYAFSGLIRPNPAFVEDMQAIGRLVSGQDDYPPGHQWTGRTPYLFAWSNMVLWGTGPALGLAGLAGVLLAGVHLLRFREWSHLLPLLWVVGGLLFFGGQFVMTMRYLQPLYPFLAMFAAFFVFAAGDYVRRRPPVFHGADRLRRRVPLVLFMIVAGYTLFWALAFVSIYTRTNTRVVASRWILQNVPDTATIATEHWDDALPLRVDGTDYYGNHEGVQMTLYDADNPEKREKMVDWLERSDYIVLSSNRLAGSIPRLPVRYPLTVRYYEALFSGELGFRLVEEFTSYPSLFGITINDDAAEEQFTVYDHPKVRIFQKTPAYSSEAVEALLGAVDLSEAPNILPRAATASPAAYRMSPAERAAAEQAGTWRSMFDVGSPANRWPALTWYFMILALGLAAFPLASVVMRGLPDKGYGFARATSVLLISWFAWSLSSYKLMPFGPPALLLGAALLLVSAVAILRARGSALVAYVRANRALFLAEELVFAVAFVLFLAIRYANADLWHPYFGGEKPMDFAFLNAILKSTSMPPYNPWFAGGEINYYYFGQFMAASLTRLSGIVPEVSYNLLVPTFYAFVAAGVFAVAANVVAGATPHRGSYRLAVLSGLLAVLLVAVAGNLAQFRLILKALSSLGGNETAGGIAAGLAAWWAGGKALPVPTGDWYWTATRVIPGTINEFPFFSFLYADLHAHVLALPFTLLALALAAQIALSRAPIRWYDLAFLALVLGALRSANTWDYPTYLALAGAALMLRAARSARPAGARKPPGEQVDGWLWAGLILLLQLVALAVPLKIAGIPASGDLGVTVLVILFGAALMLARYGAGLDPRRLISPGWRLAATAAASSLLFYPYVSTYATSYWSLELWQGERTRLPDYLLVYGVFLFLILTFFAGVIARGRRRDVRSAAGSARSAVLTWGPLAAVLIFGLVWFRLPVVALVLPLVALGAGILLAGRTPAVVRWVSLLITTGLLLTLLVELVVLKGDIGRTNTVFKFYLQAWVLLGVAGATGLGLLAAAQTAPLMVRSRGGEAVRRLWIATGASLTVLALLYPLTATPAKARDRFAATGPRGLDGLAYMAGAQYSEKDVTFALKGDREAIDWLRANVDGSPVIAEANAGLYRWGSRYSINTGLPTIIGWDWHTKQQYSLVPGELIDQRVAAVRELYDSTDSQKTLEILGRYRVSYIIVGPLERAVYSPAGLGKFVTMAEGGQLNEVYRSPEVTIYEVTPGLTSPA